MSNEWTFSISTDINAPAERVYEVMADVERWHDLVAEPGAALHLYNKGEARPGRKMGHVTRIRGNPAS